MTGADSVVASGDTLEAAAAEGARRLGLSPRETSLVVLQEGRRGFLGVGARPWRVRVERRDLLAPRLEEALRAAADIDGSFEVTHEGRVVYLIVRPPIGAGRPVGVDDAARALREMETEGWTQESLRATVEKATGRPERIGNFRHVGEIDAYLKVHLDEDRMRAFATVVPPRRGGRPLSLEGALKGLETAGVVEGVRRDRLEAAVAGKHYNEPVLAAEGTRAQDGADGRVEFLFRTDRHRVRFAEDVHGRVDYRELGIVESVVEGQPLVRLEPPTVGRDGVDVTGKRLAARPGRPARLPHGENCREEDGILRAAVTGHVTFVGGRVRVDPLFLVPGDVDISVGNVSFQGTVEIAGMIEDGFRVEATGSVLVRRSVGKATVRAGGNVVVLGGIAGKDEAVIEAEGDVVARFIERTRITAGRDVSVGEAVLHSTIIAGGEVVADTGRGAIIGGTVSAVRRVTAKVLGGEVGARTTVRVGIDSHVLARIEALQEEIRKEEKRLIPIEEALRLVASSPRVAPEVAAQRAKLEEARDRIRAVVEGHRERARALDTSLELLDPPPVIRVDDRAYAGTRIEIGRVSLTLSEPARYIHCAFRRAEGEIQVGPY